MSICTSSVMVHNTFAKLLLSSTITAVALETRIQNFDYLPFLFGTKWYKQRYKIFVLLTITKKVFL